MKTLRLVRLWFALCLGIATLASCSKPEPAARIPVFYQSPMHPWIKSDKPGFCTICGMALVPIYPGEEGMNADPDTLMLPTSSVHALGVETSVVERGQLTRKLRLAGRIDDDAGRHRFVSAHFDGRVERPFIEQVGEEVREGQPLARIYSPDLLYVVREYQGALADKNRNISDVSARRLIQFGLTLGQLEALSKQSHDQYGVDILSPITGTVIKRYVNSGQYVKTGDPLFELGDFSRMWFLATVYESDLPLVSLGQQAKITTPAAPGRSFEGVVTLVDPTFDSLTRSTMVRIEVPNPIVRNPRGERRELPHRAFAEAVLECPIGEGLLIPRTALLNTGREAIAYVQKEAGVFERRRVVVGGYGDTKFLALSGLSAGEQVVTNGNLLMDAESQMKNPETAAGSTLRWNEPASHAATPSPIPPSPWDSLLDAIAATGSALAADDLNAYHQAVAKLSAVIPKLPSPVPDELAQAVAAIGSAIRGMGTPKNLPDARADYLPLSEAAANLALILKKSKTGAGNIDILACPMTQTAFPSAPAKARWIQSGGPTRNPWFGSEMIECGVKLSPEAQP
ncbi:MAG: efflux RND transporter periplasmic adaptor subunit [bacterium]